MKEERITSRANPLVVSLRRLARSRSHRNACGEFLCDGTKMLAEALLWKAPIRTVVLADGVEAPALPDGVRLVRVPGHLMEYISPMESPQGVLFTCALPDLSLPEKLEGRRHLVLDGVQDPGNVGTILRTANAFCADSVILLPGCADAANPKTVRASMGAFFRQRVFETEWPALRRALLEQKIPLYAASLSASAVSLTEADLSRAAVVIGSEGSGVSPQVLEACDGMLKIPMNPQCESLNAAVAAAVILWELFRRTEGKR